MIVRIAARIPLWVKIDSVDWSGENMDVARQIRSGYLVPLFAISTVASSILIHAKSSAEIYCLNYVRSLRMKIVPFL